MAEYLTVLQHSVLCGKGHAERRQSPVCLNIGWCFRVQLAVPVEQRLEEGSTPFGMHWIKLKWGKRLENELFYCVEYYNYFGPSELKILA